MFIPEKAAHHLSGWGKKTGQASLFNLVTGHPPLMTKPPEVTSNEVYKSSGVFYRVEKSWRDCADNQYTTIQVIFEKTSILWFSINGSGHEWTWGRLSPGHGKLFEQCRICFVKVYWWGYNNFYYRLRWDVSLFRTCGISGICWKCQIQNRTSLGLEPIMSQCFINTWFHWALYRLTVSHFKLLLDPFSSKSHYTRYF